MNFFSFLPDRSPVWSSIYFLQNLMILKGADVNLQDKNGITPLHLASSLGCNAIILMLLNTKKIDFLRLDLYLFPSLFLLPPAQCLSPSPFSSFSSRRPSCLSPFLLPLVFPPKLPVLCFLFNLFFFYMNKKKWRELPSFRGEKWTFGYRQDSSGRWFRSFHQG